MRSIAEASLGGPLMPSTTQFGTGGTSYLLNWSRELSSLRNLSADRALRNLAAFRS